VAICFGVVYAPSTSLLLSPFFFSTDPATTDIYTLSLHDALPIWPGGWAFQYNNAHYPDLDDTAVVVMAMDRARALRGATFDQARSEEHTSELQSLAYLVCRLLLEKKKKKKK